jgi:tetratricopeptide (TPR) repeat protein
MMERFLFIAAIALSAAFATDSGQTADWKRAYLAAYDKQSAGDYAGAAAILEPVVNSALQLARDDEISAMLFTEYASVRQDLEERGRAEEFYRRGLAIWARLGSNVPGRMNALNNLATLYIERGQYSNAEQLLKDFEGMAAPPEILNSLGTTALARGDFKQAEEFYMRSVALLRSAASTPTSELGSVLNNLALIHFETGRAASGAQLYEEALSAFESSLGPRHPKLIAPLLNMAISKRVGGDPQAAEPFARRAVELAETALGPAHRYTAEALLEHSRILRQLHRKSDAKALEARARSILENNARSDPTSRYAVDIGQLAVGSER